MTEDASTKPLDWNKVHELVIDQANEVVEGFGINNVDWFLRDSNVSILDQASKPQPSTPEKKNCSEEKVHTPTLVMPSSPHLQVLNTNEFSVSKTRPSIASIQEEEAQSVLSISTAELPSKDPKRRNSASSLASVGSSVSNNGSNGGKFFSKLKHRLQRSESASASTSNGLLFRKDFEFEKPGREMPIINTSINGYSYADSHDSKSPQSAMSARDKQSIDSEEEFDDPRLQEYVKFFRQLQPKPGQKPNATHCPLKNSAVTHQIVTPIPSSPKALEGGKLSSLFRRRSSVTVPVATSPVKIPDNSQVVPDSEAPSKESVLENGLPNFKKIRPLKHVAFHSLTFLIDPPQQIPSRTPRKGNVEILPLGVVRINPLTEAEKIQIEKSLRGQGGGLVVGGTGAFGLTKRECKAQDGEQAANGEVATTDKEASKSTIDNGGSDSSSECEPKIDSHAKSLGIEKPMMHSTTKFGYKAPVKKMALDLMYSRCCHLREILPIPGIAKQIPKGSMAPLPFLQFRNPTPTMIEIETFADFIRIAPIICISLDGVNLSYEQLKILLSAMCAKTQLEKLSLRNTPLDPEGWTLFCWFLSRNKYINKLDITQCPPLSVVKKKKKVKPEEEAILRMVCNKENRSDMDWSMFTASIIARGGIEELILTGCCITDLKVFETLIRRAISIRTARLGLAYNQLSPQQFYVVLDSYFLSSTTRGLDLGYNDLLSSAFPKIITELYKREHLHEKISQSKLGFLSLNATNLRFNDLFKEVYEKFFAILPNLKYLDFSNNPKLFGNFNATILNNDANEDSSLLSLETSSQDHSNNISPESINSYFCSILPTFKNLVRLHLDNNGLSSQSLINLFEIVPFCKDLAYLSIIGNHLDIYSATSLIQGLKNSTSLMTIDGDFLGLPEKFKERIGSYSMRNMENYYHKVIRKKPTLDTKTDDLHSQALTDQLNKLLSQRNDDKFDLELPNVKLFIQRTQMYRKKLQESIQDLFALQYSGDLNIEGKEALIRLLFVDSSLERGLRLIDKSLVNQEDSITSTDIINMNLAEDENNKMKNSSLSKDSDDMFGNNNSLSQVDSAALPISRNQSSATLSSLNKEEGSVMKLSRLADNDSILGKFDDYTGEEIRQKMMNFDLSDLDNLIDTINSARKKGVCFKQIFNDKTLIDNFKDDLKKRIENVKRFAACHGKEPSEQPKEYRSEEIDLSRSTESSIPDESMSSKDINDAYDRILSKFNK